MELTFKIGKRQESIAVMDRQVIAVLNPKSLLFGKDEQKLIREALEHPVKSRRLREIIHPGEKTVIIISDATRPLPSARILPEITDVLHQTGLTDQDIQIVIARGSHRKADEEEKKSLAGEEIFKHIQVTSSGDHGYLHVGTTKRGTPVDIDADVVQARHRILLGNVEFHYFAGYSGGAKAIMPGCADPACIAFNHRHMVDENAQAGRLTGNPVREDLEEGADFTGADFIINVVLNTHKEIIYAAGGDMKAAHRDACSYLQSVYLSPIERKADIVIVSQGGAPKDINLYQTQKALDNAKYAVKDGGVIILAGACEEGFGNPVFARWMKTFPDPDVMINHLREHFELGGHKAAAMALVRKKADIFLVSNMDSKELDNTFIKPYSSLSHAYEDALKKCGRNAEIIAMPYGGSTLPVIN